MTWNDRVHPDIVFISPTSDTQFNALWSGDSRKLEKKLGIFLYPKFSGAIVQDLDVGATLYPIKFYFEGPDHDIQAGSFFNACKERGPWIVRHPVHGLLSLQLITISEDIQPVTSANMTAFESEWIEVAELPTVETVPQLAAKVISKTAAIQIKQISKFKTATVQIPQVVKSVNSLLVTLAVVKQTVAEVNATMEAIHRGITEEINSVMMSGASLAGMIQTMITLPASIITSVSATFDYFTGMASTPQSDDPVLSELICTSAMVVLCQSVTDGDLTTREESMALLDSLVSTFNTMTNNLDALSTDSQLTTYNDMAQVVSLSAQLLLRRTYDLQTAKRITLTVPRCPVEIALTENTDLDQFITGNNLKGNDIMLLPAGREVVVYL